MRIFGDMIIGNISYYLLPKVKYLTGEMADAHSLF